MRLSDYQKQAIREEVAATFGPDAEVRIFGSRLDDQCRGGDIDIHIETTGAPSELLDGELALYARLQRRLGERSLDIVVHSVNAPTRDVDRHAMATGVRI
jgi:predicted nucleotidyltransferase